MDIYVGHLAGHKDISTKKWDDLIDKAEDLLIHSHLPVYNTSNKNNINEEKIKDVHIFNWNAYKNLFPEVSGKRFTSKYDHITEDNIYGE